MGEIFNTLGFDVKMALFNLVNFTLVFLVMKKMVFSKFGVAIENRKKSAEGIIKKEAQLESELQNAKTSAKKIVDSAQEEANLIITRGQKTAEGQAAEIKKKAEVEVKAMRDRANEQIEEDMKNAYKNMQGDISDLVIAAAQRVVKTKVDADDDLELVTKTVSSLQN